MDDTIKVAVVTGGHRFDVPNFHRLFRKIEGVDAYIQPLEDFASSREEDRDFYDVAVFYNMHKEGPTDENRPGWMGRPRKLRWNPGWQRVRVLCCCTTRFWHFQIGTPGCRWPVLLRGRLSRLATMRRCGLR